MYKQYLSSQLEVGIEAPGEKRGKNNQVYNDFNEKSKLFTQEHKSLFGAAVLKACEVNDAGIECSKKGFCHFACVAYLGTSIGSGRLHSFPM